MGKTPLKIIGLGFIYLYFETLAKNEQDVAQLYSDTCEMVFVDLTRLNNLDHETYPVVKLHGKDAVKEYLTSIKGQLSTTELKIKTFDSLRIPGSDASILLSLTGEVIWSGTKTYNFTQTFVLSPTKLDDNVFEVGNSVFRITTEVVNKGERTKKYTNAPRTKPKAKHYSGMANTSPFIPASNQYQNRYNWNGYTGAMAEGSTPFYPQGMRTDYNQNFSQYSPQQNQYGYYNNNHNSYMNSNGKNGNGYSRYSDKKYNYNNKNSSDPSSNENTRASSNNSSSVTNTNAQSSPNHRKVPYYSVHVNNMENIPEDVIKETLEKEFGTIMKITTGENYLVVDFEKAIDQTACLGKGKLTINGVDITFEKKYNQRKQRSNTDDSAA